MTTKAIVASVVLVVLLFFAMLLVVSHKPPQAITVRHIKSVQSADVTTMTFEIKNRTAAPFLFSPYAVQVRNGNARTNFQDVDYHQEFGPPIGPTGLVYCTVSVTHLPAKSVVRFSVTTAKQLLGLSGLFTRVELNWKLRRGNFGWSALSLNPYDKNSPALGKPTEITSDEFVEQ